MPLRPLQLRTDEIPWTPGSAALGDLSVYQDQETVFVKPLSDRRGEGGGVAQVIRFRPPVGMLIKVLAVARSDEHIYILQGGHCDKAGRQRLFPGDYLLHPNGHRHGAFLAVETIAFVAYTGEPDELISYEILPLRSPGD
ncbi:MAG: hypothetical protein B7Z66_04740 [Chromatiales bacterium 21-64-14]|nr:MAG: hypothetical protein B7Z66_04740 [Chromatiales bacterium 21-64-14]HQU14636.1 hypothetical protein [Gammaproteobacteria bacterium]